jgi:hypothetical protein
MDRKKKEKLLKEKEELLAKQREKERYQQFLSALDQMSKKQKEAPKRPVKGEKKEEQKRTIASNVKKILEEDTPPRRKVKKEASPIKQRPEEYHIDSNHTASIYMSERPSSAPASPPTKKKRTPKRVSRKHLEETTSDEEVEYSNESFVEPFITRAEPLKQVFSPLKSSFLDSAAERAKQKQIEGL